MTVFRSAIRFPRVTFPPEQFGMGLGADFVYDAQGNRVPKPSPFKAVKFNDGAVAIEDENLIERMRKHPGNTANGGQLFWEESAQTTQAVNTLAGIQSAHPPDGGLTDEDKKMLAYLEKAALHLAPPQVGKVCDQVREAVVRFSVTGIIPPTEGMGMRRVKARVIELLGLLEDQGIGAKRDDRPRDTEGS